jgi:hypothetical protein
MIAERRTQHGAADMARQGVPTFGGDELQPRLAGESGDRLPAEHRQRVTTQEILDGACYSGAIAITRPNTL